MSSDVYPNIEALKRAMHRERDYRIRVIDRASSVTIVAPHGGFVDEGTSALARAVAGCNYNLFDFQGLRDVDAFQLHVTSTRFRDPQLGRLLLRSDFAVSLHGMGDEPGQESVIWLGGLNKGLKQLMQQALENEGFNVNPAPPRFRGEHPDNVVNLAQFHGVQLELPLSLRKHMYCGGITFYRDGKCPKPTAVFARFVRSVRASIAQHQAR
jgi:phage replication-related protein YjqB (UPF0714/DUF867 family)